MIRTPLLAVGAAALAGAAANVAPLVTANDQLRRRLWPTLDGRGQSGQVALTFDDGPDPASTPRFLDELDRLGWRATFFVLGEMVRAAPSLLREMVDAGHEVAVHGDCHRSHVLRTPWEVKADLARAAGTIGDVIGTPVRWVRPPFGSVSAGTLAAARHMGLTVVLWSAWGRDWTATATPETVLATLRPDLRAGATVLLHDSDCTSAPRSWRSALGALGLLAGELDRLGLGVVPLADHALVGAGASAGP